MVPPTATMDCLRKSKFHSYSSDDGAVTTLRVHDHTSLVLNEPQVVADLINKHEKVTNEHLKMSITDD
ncbi:cytochrome P450 [Penicillium lividum]|nr:cytochrome P450 [Penicillium lividum]